MRLRALVFAALALAGCADVDIPHSNLETAHPIPSFTSLPSAVSPGLGAPLAFVLQVRRDAEARWWVTLSKPPEAPHARLPASNHTRVVQAPPNPPAAVQRSNGTCGWGDLIASIWPSGLVSRVCAIIGRESGGNPSARNPSGASGLLQIMLPLHCHRFTELGYSCSAWSNPEANLRVGYGLYLDAGWSPWAASA